MQFIYHVLVASSVARIFVRGDTLSMLLLYENLYCDTGLLLCKKISGGATAPRLSYAPDVLNIE